MRTIVISVLAAAALITYRSEMVAAPDQVTQYPGQMTEGRVWIQNRPERGEAIPVLLEKVGRDLAPLRVQVVNGEPQYVGNQNPVLVRAAQQTWEYKTIYVGEAVDPVVLLNKEGAAGWETAGVTWRQNNLTAWLLKRPR
jgi:hypothetical protein